MKRRTLRVNGLIRQEISELLKRQVNDPRLSGLVTVTEVATSADLRHARVFVSIMGTDEEKEQALQGLSAASGFFRRELRQRLTLRYIPELYFQRDNSMEHGAHILDLIKQVTTQLDEASQS